MSRRYRPFDPFERGGPFEPGREIRLPRVPQRFWAALALFVLAVLVFIATSPIIGFITEVEWYDALGLRDVYTTRLWLEWSITIVSFVFRPTPRALAHLSVLVAAFAVTLAATTWLSRFDLLFAHNSPVVWGAGYTDVTARLPVYTLQAGVGIVVAGGLIANAWIRRLWIPLVAVGAWILMSIASQAYPAAVQQFSAGPNAGNLELPYITRSIDYTRRAYGLSDVTGSTSFTGDQPLTLKDVQNDQATINNLRLWDYTPLKDTYLQQQAIRTYYTFNDIDLDRYTVGAQYQQLEISAREFDFSRLQSASQNWFNQRLVYTHGYGAAASPVNAVSSTGLPQYVVQDVPPTGPLKISQPAIYFGELQSSNG